MQSVAKILFATHGVSLMSKLIRKAFASQEAILE